MILLAKKKKVMNKSYMLTYTHNNIYRETILG